MAEPMLNDRDSSPDFEVLRARSATKRRVIFGGVALAAVLGIGLAVVNVAQSAQREEESRVAELRGCLLAGPLESGETAWQRFRRLQLRALAVSDKERGEKGNKLWPLSCRAPLAKLEELLKTDLEPAQLEQLQRLNKFLEQPTAVSKDASAVLEPVLALLDARAPAAVLPGKEPLPPKVLNADSMASIKPVSSQGTALNRSYTEDNPGHALPVLVSEESMSAPLLCVFHDSTADTKCRSLTELASVQGHGLRLLGTSDERSPNLIFAGKRGAAGVFVAGSKEPLDSLYSFGGYATADGSAWVLGWDETRRGMVLVRKTGDTAAVRTPLNPNFRVGNYFYGSQLLWDQVLVRGITPDEERRLFALPVVKPDAGSFELVDIGELPEPGLIREGEEEQPHLTGCRSGAATVVRVRGYDSDFITFRIGDKFSQPVTAPTWGVLGCHGTTATLVKAGFAAGGTRLYHSTCTSAGCTSVQVKAQALDRDSIELRPADVRDVQAVDLGGKLLAVWLAGERGGLRLRMAPPDQFERAQDQLLFDDHVAGGKNADASTLLGFRLYSRERFAVLLLSSMAGLHAFRIGSDGAVTPYVLNEAG